MIATTRHLAATALAALRDNPLVRYGSPARRVGVPRALWWLALGSSLLFSTIASLLDVGRSNTDPYPWLLFAAALLMPIVAGVSFLGFGFPYRQQEHLDDLALAGLKPTDFLVGFLCWPVVACGLVVAPLLTVPWATALAAALTNQVSQSVEQFGWRVLGSAALALWMVLCLAVAARVWDRRAKRGWLVPFETAALCSVHLLWLLTCLMGNVFHLPGLFVALGQTGFSRLWLFATLTQGFLTSRFTWVVLAVLMLAAVVFEGARSAYHWRKAREGAEKPGERESAAIERGTSVPLPWWAGWFALVPLGMVAFELLNIVMVSQYRLHLELIMAQTPMTGLNADGALATGAMPVVLVMVVLAAMAGATRGGARVRWTSDGHSIADTLGPAARPAGLLIALFFLRSFARPEYIPSRNLSPDDLLALWATGYYRLLEPLVLALAVAASLRPAGPRKFVAALWLFWVLVVLVPTPQDLFPDLWRGANNRMSLLLWDPLGGRSILVTLTAVVFLAFGWRACAMWFELTKHRLVDPEGAPR